MHLAILWPFLLWGPGHSIFTLFVVILVLSLVFRRRHYYYFDRPWGRSRSDARDILESRYARGEIQRDEYLQKKQDLG